MAKKQPHQDETEAHDLSQYLDSLNPREDATAPLKVSTPSQFEVLDQPGDMESAAVAVWLLEKIAAHKGTKLALRSVRNLRERILKAFDERDIMSIEVEAYNAAAWLVGLTDRPVNAPPPPRKSRLDAIYYDPSTSVFDLLKRSIVEKFDVEIMYYTHSRGELSRRMVSPIHIEAETYLHAYCHQRRSERVFRVSRIAEIHPVDGRVVHKGKRKKKLPPAEQGALDLDK